MGEEGHKLEAALRFCGPDPPELSAQSPTVMQRRCLPEDVVDAHDALWLRVAAVVNDRSLGLHPHEAAGLRQHSILAAHRLTLAAHCRRKKRGVNHGSLS